MDFHRADGLPRLRHVREVPRRAVRIPPALPRRLTIPSDSQQEARVLTAEEAAAEARAVAVPADLGEVKDNVYAGVYRVLMAGMFLSSGLFLLGMLRALASPRTYPLSAAWVRSHYHLGALADGILTLDPFALMLVATFLLILTPVVRVGVSIYAFAIDGDRKYVVVTSIVLAVILLTIALSEFAGLK